MPSMTTVLYDVTIASNSRTKRTSAHTIAKPRLVIQKEKFASTPASVADSSVRVLFGTADSAGELLAARVSFEVNVRRPANGDAADTAAALALFREMVASDEFAGVVNSQSWL